MNFLLFRIARRPTVFWLNDAAIPAIHFVILRSPVSSTGRREDLILLNLFEE
ncbi:MAG: hypothetical protein PHU16_06255 [Atribacterota bacterium]|nr:hypothetical protein [Atribacterota bacterium]HHT10076.1 hypothetical protein [Candidatus Atribacteria bacterium]